MWNLFLCSVVTSIYEHQKLLRYGTQCSIMSMSIIAQKRIWRGWRCGSCCVCNNNLEGHNWCHNVKVSAPSGNRTQGNCLEGNYVTTTPMVLFLKLQVSSIITIPHHWEQIKDLRLFSWTFICIHYNIWILQYYTLTIDI